MTLGFVIDADHLFFKNSPFNRVRNYEEAMPWLRQLVADLSPEKPGFYPKPLHVGFVGDRVALGQVYLQIL
jgi:hypothetical protein